MNPIPISQLLIRENYFLNEWLLNFRHQSNKLLPWAKRETNIPCTTASLEGSCAQPSWITENPFVRHSGSTTDAVGTKLASKPYDSVSELRFTVLHALSRVRIYLHHLAFARCHRMGPNVCATALDSLFAFALCRVIRIRFSPSDQTKTVSLGLVRV